MLSSKVYVDATLRYAEIRAEGMRGGDGGESATEFYRQNQAAMDDGAVVAWQERFNYDELSAIQHAMNLKLQDEAALSRPGIIASKNLEPSCLVATNQITDDSIGGNHPLVVIPLIYNLPIPDD